MLKGVYPLNPIPKSPTNKSQNFKYKTKFQIFKVSKSKNSKKNPFPDLNIFLLKSDSYQHRITIVFRPQPAFYYAVILIHQIDFRNIKSLWEWINIHATSTLKLL